MCIPTRALALVLSATLCPAQEPDSPLAGHSGHGEVFNEGPRQAAHAIDGTGAVQLRVTTHAPRAQSLFDQGIGQLHGFWYFEAERSFRQVAAIDPNCAMAYWGMAMANVDNEERATGFASEAWKLRAKATRHEQLYIESLARFYDVMKPAPAAAKKRPEKKSPDKKPAGKTATPGKPSAKKPGAAKKVDDKARRRRLVLDLERLIFEFPEDIEAKAFLVNQLWLNSRRGIPISSKQANDALLQLVFAKQPMHPAHHYRIHLWDKKDTVERVVDSAIKSGLSAPGIAHMWHMGGHTFDKLGRFSDAAWQQAASARVDHAYMMRERVMPFRIHNYAHNQEWCVRSLLAVGRVREALSLAKNLIELPRHPEKNRLDKRGQAASYGRQRLIQVLTTAELWPEALRLADTMYLEDGVAPVDRAMRSALLARACLESGRADEASAHIEDLRNCIAAERKLRAASVDAAEAEALEEDKRGRALEDAMTAAMRKHSNGLRDLRRSLHTLETRRALLAEKADAETVAAFAKANPRADGLGRLWLMAGKPEAAIAVARKAAAAKKNHVYPLADLVAALWSAGKKKDAQTEFEKLRKLSSEIELDTAPMARLAPIAKSLGWPEDWRVPFVRPDDVKARPSLDALGPFRWSPTPARAWRLPHAKKGDLALADYRGKPVLVVFFLGFGCVHCVEQLQALKPMTADFERAGIEIVTIGTDSVDDVAMSLAAPGEGYDFPILSDPDGAVFKQYRAWDDFENMPLHGTFLVDADGLVRWQDISYEPFMETEFLLRECKRLLALPAAAARR